MEWNQTFTFTLDTGNEKLWIYLYLDSIALGKVLLDTLEINLGDHLTKLGDQKLKQMMFVTEKEIAYDLIMKWRYDETEEKIVENNKKIMKIR